MAGVSSRHGTIAFAKQSSKGTPAGAPVVKFFLAGQPSLMPQKPRGRFAMTDNNRDQGDAYTQSLSVGGDLQVYCHYEGMANLFYYVLGANADSGSNPNYIHTITPAADLPWVTVWYMRGGSGGLVEQFVDCKVNSLALEGSAGSPLTASLNLLGCTSNYLGTSDTGLAALTTSPAIYPELKGELKVDGAAAKLSQFNWSIDNGTSPYQADDFFYEDIDVGGRAFTLGFATRFTGPTAFPDYKGYFYAGGTTLVGTVAAHTFAAKATRNSNLHWTISHPDITYSQINGVHADPGGAPIEVQVAAEVERASPTVTVTVADQTATVG